MADRNRDRIGNHPHPFVEEIDHNEIQLIEVVGRGSFGTVHKALWRDKYVAVKYIEQESERSAFTIEVRQLSRVAHPNIVALYGACTKRPNVCLVMEYAEGGSLYNVLHCNPKLRYTAAHAMSWAKQCAEGVAYLHSMRPNPLIHRDLKPPNLLLINGGRKLKICDFGTVADKATMMTNNKGSAAWMAPEVFEGSTYTEKCDVYSWGIILWEVLSREQPFKRLNDTYRIMWSVHTGVRPPLLQGCPQPIENLMTTCWDKDPRNRPSMGHVVEEMTVLLQLFPGAELPFEYEDVDDAENTFDEDSVSNVDTNQSLYDSYVPSFSRDASNISSQVPELHGGFDRHQHSAPLRNQLQQSQNRNLTVNDNIDARWASPDGDNSEPRIIAEPLRSFTHSAMFEDEQNAMRSKDLRNGMVMTGLPMEQLTLECDPQAWDLQPDELDNERLIGNISNNHGNERLTVTETKSTIPPGEATSASASAASSAASSSATETASASAASRCSTDSEASLDLDSLYLMLEPHLRPATPDPNSRVSQKIFEEHNDLAKEYLKVQTDLAYVTKHREELLAAMDVEQQRERLELSHKLTEKEALVQLEANLKRQLQLIRTATRPQPAQTQYGAPPNITQSNPTPSSHQQFESPQVRRTASHLLEEDGWVYPSSKP